MSKQAKTSGVAIAALIMTFVCFPVGLILGVIALVQISNAEGELGGQTLAVVAVVLSGISVPLVGVVAAIAIPNFVRYQLRAKAGEARVNLEQIRAAQEAAFQRYGRYLSAGPTLALPSEAKQPWTAAPCDVACSAEQPTACSSFACMDFEPSEDVYFSYACEVSEDGRNFTCAALGDLDGNQEYSLYVLGNGTEELVAPIPDFDGQSPGCLDSTPNRVLTCTPGTF